MTKSISEILKEAASRKKITDRAEVLQANDSPVLQGVLKLAFQKEIKWALPEGTVDYNETKSVDNQQVLFSEFGKFYMFLEGGMPELRQLKRETIFIQMLEALDPEDAKLILAIKDHVMPYEGITDRVVDLAFPGLIVRESVDG